MSLKLLILILTKVSFDSLDFHIYWKELFKKKKSNKIWTENIDIFSLLTVNW